MRVEPRDHRFLGLAGLNAVLLFLAAALVLAPAANPNIAIPAPVENVQPAQTPPAYSAVAAPPGRALFQRVPPAEPSPPPAPMPPDAAPPAAREPIPRLVGVIDTPAGLVAFLELEGVAGLSRLVPGESIGNWQVREISRREIALERAGAMLRLHLDPAP